MALLSVKECQRIQFILKAHTIDNQRELKFKLEILSSPVGIPFCIVNVTLCMDFLMCGILPIPLWVFRHINFHALSVLDAFSVIMTLSTCFQMSSNLNCLKGMCSMFGSCVSTMVMPATQKMSLADVKRFGESNCSFDLSLFI